MMDLVNQLDRQIVNLLMEDGRMGCAEIARRIGGVSERTIRYRLDRLVERRVIRVAAIPNPRILGYGVTADVYLQVEPGAIREVAERLADYECVSYVACSLGDIDVSLQVVGRSNEEIYEFVTGTLAKVPGVRNTTTLIVPVTLKDVYQWRIPSGGCADAAPEETSAG
jgi:Lrp/AsnC family transcriptional regulator for asnA, asnC and gidA